LSVPKLTSSPSTPMMEPALSAPTPSHPTSPRPIRHVFFFFAFFFF
jgi:hypothetical protein